MIKEEPWIWIGKSMRYRRECSAPHCRRVEITRQLCALHNTSPKDDDKPIALVGYNHVRCVIHEAAGSRWMSPKCGTEMYPGIRIYNIIELMEWKKEVTRYNDFIPRQCKRCYV